MSPTGLVCDRRLIQKYIAEATDLEEQMRRCEELPLLNEPVQLPLVGFNLRDWIRKTNQAKGQEVLHNLGKLVEGTAAVQNELRQGCAVAPLQQLYERASTFLLHLRNFRGQEEGGGEQPEGASRVTPERNPKRIFQTYTQLVRGKLHFLFQDLWRDSCSREAPGDA
ncbi:thrombopoietin isoform X2 [Eublepharis macularius]|nr:thrombopoietin isoform X2 [Eublepharis macularius]